MDALPQFEGCQVVERVRSGPIADLYHAVQQPLGRPVLIKALSSAILPSSPFAATLEREARLLADLHHPNVLHVYDFVRKDERMWLVLEYVDGWPLDELLKTVEHLAPSSAAAIALELARALDHAHAHGVIHRDLQPRNVLVSRQGQVKLLNFSVAVDERLPTAPELVDGAISGPAYMSPEQILGEPADPRSDLFSLGVVLYEMLSGERPFQAPDERTATQRIRHDAPAPLARKVAGLPGALERIVQRCLAKLPSDRFYSASELAGALEDVLEHAGATSARKAIGAALADAGLLEAEPASSGEPSVPAATHARHASLAPAFWGLFACLGLLVVGGGAIQLASRGGGASRPGRSSALELVPARPAYLRVVAIPWAHVSVDGQRIDTTPFARSIPLRPGTHYVRLEHPNAPTERRTVQLMAGETVLLDVEMNVPPAPPRQRQLPDAAADAGDAGDGGGDARPSP